MRIAFYGLPLGALLLHADGHTIVHAALCRADAVGRRRLRHLLDPARVSLKPALDDPAFARMLADAKPDLTVSWFWTTRLPMQLVDLAPLGGFGVHPSLLPRHRGPDPTFWAIDAGDAVTGVTAHRLAADYDTGAILAQRTVAIDPSWNAWTLAKRLDRPSLALLREVAAAYARGAPPEEQAQDATEATEAPTPDDALLEIDWHRPSDAIARRVRAASPWPGAYTFFGEEAIVLTRVRAATAFPAGVARALAPGEATVIDGRAFVRSGDGLVELLAGRAGVDEEYPLDEGDLADLVETLNRA